jgi:hypothetical protein
MRSVTAIRRSMDPAGGNPTARPRGRSYRTPRGSGPAEIRCIRLGARRWTRSISMRNALRTLVDAMGLPADITDGLNIQG